jgi:hypothetical protein
MTEPAPSRSESAAPMYVCENCGRLGTMDAFQTDCTPGWTHGRLIKVTRVSVRQSA